MTQNLFLLKKRIDTLIGNALEKKVFPGAAIGISAEISGRRENLLFSYGYGGVEPKIYKMEERLFFDLASLTKPLATTLAVLCLLKAEKISWDEKLPSLLEKKIKQENRNITLRQILCHCSGLPAYRSYYQGLMDVRPEKRKDILIKWLLQERLVYEPETYVLYSDLGFLLLGKIIEKKGKEKLEDFVSEKVMKPLGLDKKIFFRPISVSNERKKSMDLRFVATERCPWRQKVLCGEVHDDNAWAIGGVAGHAGLFGDIEGVLSLTVAIMDQWQGKAVHPNYRNADLKRVLTKQRLVKKSTWALGFDTPAKKGSSSGKYFSKKSVGHLGFTGTSFWMDPEKRIVIVLLTNRVHPQRDNIKIKEFRPLFHDTVMKGLIIP